MRALKVLRGGVAVSAMALVCVALYVGHHVALAGGLLLLAGAGLMWRELAGGAVVLLASAAFAATGCAVGLLSPVVLVPAGLGAAAFAVLMRPLWRRDALATACVVSMAGALGASGALVTDHTTTAMAAPPLGERRAAAERCLQNITELLMLHSNEHEEVPRYLALPSTLALSDDLCQGRLPQARRRYHLPGEASFELLDVVITGAGARRICTEWAGWGSFVASFEVRMGPDQPIETYQVSGVMDEDPAAPLSGPPRHRARYVVRTMEARFGADLEAPRSRR